MTSEDRIRVAVERFVEAFRARDVDGVMRLFAPDVISFDIVPPLVCVGADALREHWRTTFAAYDGTIDYRVTQLEVVVGGAVAFAHSLNWSSGTLLSGDVSERWLRWTACLRERDGEWLVVHEHVSVPVDPRSGRSVPGLTPEG